MPFLLFSTFIRAASLFCFIASVHQTNSFQDFSATESKPGTVLWMIFPVRTHSPSWLLSFPSYCTIRMTTWDLLDRRCILNNPERRWHSLLSMGPMQTPLSCWKGKLRSDWCGVFQQGMIKNKNLGEGRYFEEKLLYSQKKRETILK